MIFHGALVSVDVGCSCGDTSNQNPVHCPDRTRRGVMWGLGLFRLHGCFEGPAGSFVAWKGIWFKDVQGSGSGAMLVACRGLNDV